MYGITPRLAHSKKCRHRVIETASTNQDVAARVTKTVDRDMAYHAKRLEAEKEKERKQEDEEVPEGKRARKESPEPEVSGPFVENDSFVQSSSSSSSKPMPKVKSKFDEGKKREVKIKGEGTGGCMPTDPSQPRPEVTTPRTPAAPQVYQSSSGRTFRLRPRNDEEEENRPSKAQRLDLSLIHI